MLRLLLELKEIKLIKKKKVVHTFYFFINLY